MRICNLLPGSHLGRFPCYWMYISRVLCCWVFLDVTEHALSWYQLATYAVGHFYQTFLLTYLSDISIRQFYQTVLSDSSTRQFYQTVLPDSSTRQFYQTVLPDSSTRLFYQTTLPDSSTRQFYQTVLPDSSTRHLKFLSDISTHISIRHIYQNQRSLQTLFTSAKNGLL